MASILVIEDGSIVESANSYASAEEARAYAALRGLTLPVAPAEGVDPVEQYLIQAMDFIEAQRARFQGTKVDAAQALQFPRNDVYIDGELFAYDDIPLTLKQAQIRLAIELSAGVDPMATVSGPFVKKETVGPISTEYSESNYLGPSIPAVDALLEPLYGLSIVGMALTTVRV